MEGVEGGVRGAPPPSAPIASPHLQQKARKKSDQPTAEMEPDQTRTVPTDSEEGDFSGLGVLEEQGGNIPKRHARVTVKYNRKELQKRLDVEKWIEESLEGLYRGQVSGWVQIRQTSEDFM